MWLMVNAAINLHAVFQISMVSYSILSRGLTSANALQLVCCSICLLAAAFYHNARTCDSGIVASINQLGRLKELNTGRHLGSHACTHFDSQLLYKIL